MKLFILVSILITNVMGNDDVLLGLVTQGDRGRLLIWDVKKSDMSKIGGTDNLISYDNIIK